MSDAVLIVWLILAFVWDCIVMSACTYLVFWRNASGWWYVLAVILCCSGTLFKVLRKRYGSEEV